jgi:hypothetical protein
VHGTKKRIEKNGSIFFMVMIFSSQSFFVFSVADNSVFPVPVKSDEANPQNQKDGRHYNKV